MAPRKRNCLYAYKVVNKRTREETAIKLGETSLRGNIKDIYSAIHTRIRQECVHSIKSTLGEEFEPGLIYFCVVLDEEDRIYDMQEIGHVTRERDRDDAYFKRRCRFYERAIHVYLKERGFHRSDMYIVKQKDGQEIRGQKTEFFKITNAKNEKVLGALDTIMGPDNLNIDANAQLWTLCAGCNDYAKEEDGQKCDECEYTWCHQKCAASYKKRHSKAKYNYSKGEFICHNCS